MDERPSRRFGRDTEVSPEEMGLRFERYRRSPDRRLRDELVEDHLTLADFHAARFASSVAGFEDLRQVACIGVMGAVERFDPSMGVSFKTFASRTVEGECKRYLRDRTWAVRPPRRSQERYLALRRMQEELTHQLGRSPAVSELASALGESEEWVIDGLEAGQARAAAGLEPRIGDDAPRGGVGEPADDRTGRLFDRVDLRMSILPLVEQLPERDRTLVEMRFMRQMTETQIAEELSLSQSYVSRCLRRILRNLRRRIEAGEASRPSARRAR